MERKERQSLVKQLIPSKENWSQSRRWKTGCGIAIDHEIAVQTNRTLQNYGAGRGPKQLKVTFVCLTTDSLQIERPTTYLAFPWGGLVAAGHRLPIASHFHHTIQGLTTALEIQSCNHDCHTSTVKTDPQFAEVSYDEPIRQDASHRYILRSCHRRHFGVGPAWVEGPSEVIMDRISSPPSHQALARPFYFLKKASFRIHSDILGRLVSCQHQKLSW
jgi:hypothetical protein